MEIGGGSEEETARGVGRGVCKVSACGINAKGIGLCDLSGECGVDVGEVAEDYFGGDAYLAVGWSWMGEKEEKKNEEEEEGR